MHAWGKIKKPYKDLMAFLLSSPFHVFILGREGNSFDKNEETGEMEQTGKKMKAEGETAHEPHILIQMISERDKKTGKITPLSMLACLRGLVSPMKVGS